VHQRAGWKACTTIFHLRAVAAAHNNAFSAHRSLFSYKFLLIDHVQHQRRPLAAPAVFKSIVLMQLPANQANHLPAAQIF